jgi:DNA-binding protein H-NS
MIRTKKNLASMSIDELLKLRDDIGRTLSRKAAQLKDELSRLEEERDYKRRGRGSLLKGWKVAIKYRDKSGNTWAGRGAQPVWLREKLKAGAKLEDFAVHCGFWEHSEEATKGKALRFPREAYPLKDGRYLFGGRARLSECAELSSSFPNRANFSRT